MPEPSSTTRIRPKPPAVAVTSIRDAPASIALPTHSLTTPAGRSASSPAAMRLTRFCGSARMAIGMSLGLGFQVAAGEDFTRFDRRLVERIDPQKMARKNGFQHEMHHQGAKGALVQHL